MVGVRTLTETEQRDAAVRISLCRALQQRESGCLTDRNAIAVGGATLAEDEQAVDTVAAGPANPSERRTKSVVANRLWVSRR
jgi:hypothetical protein